MVARTGGCSVRPGLVTGARPLLAPRRAGRQSDATEPDGPAGQSGQRAVGATPDAVECARVRLFSSAVQEGLRAASRELLDAAKAGGGVRWWRLVDRRCYPVSVAHGVEALELSRRLVDSAAVPKRAARDATHVAIAAVHGVEFLVTWNFRHIANAVSRPRIESICRRSGVEPLCCALLKNSSTWRWRTMLALL